MSKQPSKDRQKIPAAPPKIASKTAQAEFRARDRILEMLSDTEMAKVSSAETASSLDEGEEYLDLEHLEQGVKQADGSNSPMGHVLPRRAVREKTWSQILTQLPQSSKSLHNESRH